MVVNQIGIQLLKLYCFRMLFGVSTVWMIGCVDESNNNEFSSDEWPNYGGNNGGNRYSDLNQINLSNVDQLEVVWMYDASDQLEPDEKPKEIQCQPIVVDNVLYGTSPKIDVFALNAATGKELWRFKTSVDNQGFRGQNRGVSYWENGKDKSILFVAGNQLMALDASNGKLRNEFGSNGSVDFHVGLENDWFNVYDYGITATSPGVIYKDVLVIGSRVSESGNSLPGSIRGFNVRTGELLWTFHTIPRPGEHGYETWPKDAYKKFGGANNWSGMVLDDVRGKVYLGTGSPSVDFYGGDREGANLFANCILSLDAQTGKLEWYFQTIHHDLWDLDLPNPPNLVTVKKDEKKVDAVIQTTKDGLVYVLDRDTGVSIFPVEERAVPTNGLPGEHPFPTQKFPLKPLPLVTRQDIRLEDLPDSILFPESNREMKDRFLRTSGGTKFQPPSEKGAWYIGISGGAEWGGSAADPDGILYQNVSEEPWEVKMVNMVEKIKQSTSIGNTIYLTNCAACHGENMKGDGAMYPSLEDAADRFTNENLKDIIMTGRGRMPAFSHLPDHDIDSLMRYIVRQDLGEVVVEQPINNEMIANDGENFPYMPPFNRGSGGKVTDSDGYPGIKPPWGTLNAIDLNTGDYLWRVPLGEYEELSNRGVPITGTPNTGGPIVTAGGLIFIAGTDDEKIRAFNKDSGQVVWEYKLPTGAFATPITYMVEGKQYVVIAAGGVRLGHPPGGNYIAFSLPSESRSNKN